MKKLKIDPYLSTSSLEEYIKIPNLVKIPNVKQLIDAGCLDELIEFTSSTFPKQKIEKSKKNKLKWLLALILALFRKLKIKFKSKKKKSNNEINKNLSLLIRTFLNPRFFDFFWFSKYFKELFSFNFFPFPLINSKKSTNYMSWMTIFIVLPKLIGGYLPIKVMHDSYIYKQYIENGINNLTNQFQKPSLTKNNNLVIKNKENIGISMILKELQKSYNTQYDMSSAQQNVLKNLWNWNLGINIFQDTLNWITKHISKKYIEKSEIIINELWQQSNKTKESTEITIEKFEKWMKEIKEDYETYKSIIQNIFNIEIQPVDELFKEINRKFINDSLEKVTKDFPNILSKQLLDESNQIKESIDIYIDVLKKLNLDSEISKIKNLKNEISSLYKNLENNSQDYKNWNKEQIKTLNELKKITKEISYNSSNYLTSEKLMEIQETQDQVLEKVINLSIKMGKDMLEKKYGGIEFIKQQITSIDNQVISSNQKQQIKDILDTVYGNSEKEITEEQIFKSLEIMEKTPSKYEEFWRNYYRVFQNTSDRWANKCSWGFQWLCRGTWDYVSGGIWYNLKSNIRSYNMFGKINWSALLDTVGNIFTIISIVSLVNQSFVIGRLGLTLGRTALATGVKSGTKKILVNAGKKFLTNPEIAKETIKRLGIQANKKFQKVLLNGKTIIQGAKILGNRIVVDQKIITGMGIATASVVGGTIALNKIQEK